MVSKSYVNKVGSTPATQGALKSKRAQQKRRSSFTQGAGQTSSSTKRAFGGVKRAR